jgi:hypothetical protein
MRHNNSSPLHHQRLDKRDETKIHRSIAKVFRSASTPCTPEFPHTQRPGAPPRTQTAPGELCAETTRRFVYQNGTLVPDSRVPFQTVPSLSLADHVSPRRKRFSSFKSKLHKFIHKNRKHDVSSNKPEFSNPFPPDPDSGYSTSRPSPRNGTNTPVASHERNVTSEEYYRTRQPSGEPGKLCRRSSLVVKNGSRETIESIYEEMNRNTSGGRTVFCSWGDGVDEIVPENCLRKYSVGK